MQHLLTQQRAHRANDEGFTLIELLVVIVILGILAAVVVFSVAGVSDKGEVSACQATAKTVETASEAYRAQNPGYAANLQALGPWIHDVQASGDTITLKAGKSVTYHADGTVTDNC